MKKQAIGPKEYKPHNTHLKRLSCKNRA